MTFNRKNDAYQIREIAAKVGVKFSDRGYKEFLSNINVDLLEAAGDKWPEEMEKQIKGWEYGGESVSERLKELTLSRLGNTPPEVEMKRMVEDGWEMLKHVPIPVQIILFKIMESRDRKGKALYFYNDNARACLVGDPVGEKEYNDRRKKGCCGFYDETIEHCGKTYKVGFNYGH